MTVKTIGLVQPPTISKRALSSGLPKYVSRRRTVCSVATETPKDVAMTYNKFGNSDLLVSEVSMGTMTFGSQNTEEDAFEQLSYAWDCGVNFLDTSECYPVMPQRETQGRCSSYVGNWMQTRKRDEVIVATKVAGRSEVVTWIPSTRTDPPGEEKTAVVNREAITNACEGELRRLQTDYLDLFQIHWPDRYRPTFGKVRYRPENEYESTPFDEQVQAMGDLIEAGKIRYWGLSNESAYGTIMMCLAADKLGVPRPISIQNSYSLLDRNFDSELAEVCSSKHFDMVLLPWSASGGGCLSGKYVGGVRPEGSRLSLLGDRYPRFFGDRVEAAISEYVKIAEEAGVTPTQLAYLFCKSRWHIPSTLIGATKMEQLKENISGFTTELSQETLDKIDEVHLKFTNPQNMD
ncbi:hypothetical protein BSKO_07931 [Bryopsis sp. KO-2023]|nr:hypothetical protein BSKO_07931 [Bryopsis sp. KO-2023]